MDPVASAGKPACAKVPPRVSPRPRVLLLRLTPAAAGGLEALARALGPVGCDAALVSPPPGTPLETVRHALAAQRARADAPHLHLGDADAVRLVAGLPAGTWSVEGEALLGLDGRSAPLDAEARARLLREGALVLVRSEAMRDHVVGSGASAAQVVVTPTPETAAHALVTHVRRHVEVEEVSADDVLELEEAPELADDALAPWLAQLLHGYCPPEGVAPARPLPPPLRVPGAAPQPPPLGGKRTP